jgi:hypothetical protein
METVPEPVNIPSSQAIDDWKQSAPIEATAKSWVARAAVVEINLAE